LCGESSYRRNGEALIRMEVDQGFGSNYGVLPPEAERV
jgi:hypothetical protein